MIVLSENIRALPLAACTEAQLSLLCQAFNVATVQGPAAIAFPGEMSGGWMWDANFLRKGDAFAQAVPACAESEELKRVFVFWHESDSPGRVDQLLEKCSDPVDEQEAILGAVELRAFCYRRNESAEILWKRLRDTDWTRGCFSRLPIAAWEMIGDGLMHVQRREGGKWASQMPYLYLCGAEQNSTNKERAAFFLRALLTSSLSGGSIAGVKEMLRNPKLPELREALLALRNELQIVYANCNSVAAPRIREMLAVLAFL